MRKLFGTDGIRGKAHQYPLDPATMIALGEALAHRLRPDGEKPRVLLGMDTRESGPEIALALREGLRRGGGEGHFVGVVPTPAVAYLCRTTDALAGISISASHNPWEDNGVKIFGADGMKLADELELAIENELGKLRKDGESAAENALSSEDRDLVLRYEEFLIGNLREGSLSPLHIVLDPGHGAATRIAPEVFRRLGAKVDVIHDQPNGRNINDGAGALHPETLGKKVRELGADLGVAFDGDADRAIFVDDQGEIRDGDEVILLWARQLKNEGKLAGSKVVTTVMSNLGFEKQLASEGIELLRAKVGDKYVLEQMRAHGAVLGGEQSGHVIDLRVHTTGDGIHTALEIARLVAESGTPFSKLETFTPVPQVLLNEKVAAKPPLDTLPRYSDAAKRAEAKLGDRGRILVRYSGTENLVRVMVEGEDDGEIRSVAAELASVLREEIAAS